MCRMHKMYTNFCHQMHMRTFRASHFVLLNIDALAKGSPLTFGGVGGRQAFISEVTAWATREAIDPTRVPLEVHRFLANVVWEPVDGQHILWACQHIARDEHERGTLRVEVYERFLQRPATVLVYDNPRLFISESRHANVHHCSRQ